MKLRSSYISQKFFKLKYVPVVSALFMFLTVSLSFASAKTVMTKSMSFEQCIIYVASVAVKLGTNPVKIVDTDLLMMARFYTNDGTGVSFIGTCSRPDRKFVLTESD